MRDIADDDEVRTRVECAPRALNRALTRRELNLGDGRAARVLSEIAAIDVK